MPDTTGEHPDEINLGFLGLPPAETKALETVTNACLNAAIAGVRELGWLAPEEVPAALAAERERAANLTTERDVARHDAALLRALAGEILAEFSNAKGDGYRARVGQVRYAKWRDHLSQIGGETP